ncbi:helix-turn-helix domain-containing protein [Bifidobacterium pseudolongum]|uniref:helix-turn-helix domain-containing protein n=1 Tax=Bifidobacterium pseudolongum TaxID=1694 RepID=UPI00102075D3|nr:helix-turn-helix domain-containing protein [Bifidobacterium pseudolongum]RYQ74590.1 replication initiation protein [Bifidobacterium pseudolongum subsp. globosum]
MSLDSMHWGLYKAGPAIDDSNAFRVLLRLADETDPAGRNAFPSAQTIADDIGSCVRTVYSKLRWLERVGLIRRGDQRAAAYLPKRHRPTVWDLAVELDTPDKVRAALADNEQARHAKIAGHTTIADPADTGRHTTADPSPRPASDLQTDLQSDLQATCNHVADDPNKPNNPITQQTVRPRATRTTQAAQSDGRSDIEAKRRERFERWQPGDKARAKATQLRADLTSELEKFRTVVTDNGKYPPCPEKSFLRWLDSGARRGLLDKLPSQRPSDQPADTTHRHTLGCQHVLDLLTPHESQFDHEGGRGSNPWISARSHLADLLNQGTNPDVALADILQEAAA